MFRLSDELIVVARVGCGDAVQCHASSAVPP